jgi:hypothetical protein
MQSIRKFVMEARRSAGKKKDKGGDAAKRSRFLSFVMPFMAGDAGKALAEAIEQKDIEKFKSLWGSATTSIIAKLEVQFKEGKKE